MAVVKTAQEIRWRWRTGWAERPN